MTSVCEGVSVAPEGMGTGARPMCEMCPFLHDEMLKKRLRLVAVVGGRCSRPSIVEVELEELLDARRMRSQSDRR